MGLDSLSKIRYNLSVNIQYGLFGGKTVKRQRKNKLPKTHDEMIEMYAKQVLALLTKNGASKEDWDFLVPNILAGTCSSESKTYSDILNKMNELGGDNHSK